MLVTKAESNRHPCALHYFNYLSIQQQLFLRVGANLLCRGSHPASLLYESKMSKFTNEGGESGIEPLRRSAHNFYLY